MYVFHAFLICYLETFVSFSRPRLVIVMLSLSPSPHMHTLQGIAWPAKAGFALSSCYGLHSSPAKPEFLTVATNLGVDLSFKLLNLNS